MPPLSFSQLVSLALEIKEETADGANTAERVGSFLLALVRSATLPFDPGATYAAGQYMMYANAVWRSMDTIAIGESPALAPGKWRLLSGLISLDVALKNGANSQVLPMFEGGLAAVLPAKSDGLTLYNVMVGPDGTFYADVPVVMEPDPGYNFSTRVHYEAVPEVAQLTFEFNTRVHFEAVPAVINANTPPLLSNPSPDIEFTSFGTSVKTLPADEFVDPGDTFTRTAIVVSGGVNGVRSELPPFLSFDGATGALTATLDPSIDNYSFVLMVECTDSLGQKADPDLILISVNVPRTSGNPAPTIVNRQGDVVITTAGDYVISLPGNEFADNAGDPGYTVSKKWDRATGTEQPFLPTGVTANEGTRKITVSGSVPNQQFSILRRYVDSAEQAIWYAFDVIVARPVALVRIDRMAVYLPLGWHGVYFGNLSENIVLLVNVVGGSSSTPVYARYPQSRNDSTFGSMQLLDYANNPGPNVLPDGFTHYALFNDEVFSTGLKTFQAKINNVAGSTVEASVLINANSAEHTTTQIFPTTN